jgi:hypothetical protein
MYNELPGGKLAPRVKHVVFHHCIMTLDKEFLFEASLLLNLDHDFFFRSPFQAQQAAQQRKRCMDRLK